MKIGVDVGGTHTDAIVVHDGEVVASYKAVTTPDIGGGIRTAVERLIDSQRIERDRVTAVMVGTTQFTNAVVERRHLSPVAVLRIGAQSSAALPPFPDWPSDLVAATRGLSAMIDGGNEYDGSDIVALDEAAVDAAIDAAADKGLENFAVSAVFAPVNADMELRVAKRIGERLPGARVSLSHRIGRLGLIQRENATILNAALMGFAQDVVDGLLRAFDGLGIHAPLFVSQNDGTVMTTDFLRQFPVLTFSSGPTNSMRGAAYLSGLHEAMVIDVGGTTTDIGMLIKGFPRESALTVDIGGVSSNFRMPDVLSLGLGGGSVVGEHGGAVGPGSVGHELTDQALCFGGGVMTASDIGVAAGLAAIGDPALARAAIDGATLARARAVIRAMVAAGVERMKTHAGDLPLVAVGGGAFLVPEDLPGISQVIRPAHGAFANAIGAALAQVGGEAEVIYERGGPSGNAREQALSKATATARAQALAAGAHEPSLKLFDVEEMPMSYLAKPAVRLRVKVIGDLVIKGPGKS